MSSDETSNSSSQAMLAPGWKEQAFLRNHDKITSSRVSSDRPGPLNNSIQSGPPPLPLVLTQNKTNKKLFHFNLTKLEMLREKHRQEETQPPPPPVVNKVQNSCDRLFSFDSYIEEGPCIRHALLGVASCKLGQAQVDLSKISGSLGNETVTDVLGRSEAEENLKLHHGAFRISNAFLPQSVLLDDLSRIDRVKQLVAATAPLEHALSSVDSLSVEKDDRPTLLVIRGDYANPCLVLITMFDVYVAMRQYGLLKDKQQPRIIWMDGHARTGMDSVWKTLFGDDIHYVRQLKMTEFQDLRIVGKASPFSDQGIHLHNKRDVCSQSSSSALFQFRSFVLERYGIRRSEHNQKRLTFLIRTDYLAHPRSDGITDRKVANPASAAAYLQRLYPEYNIETVSFEEMDFAEQLRQIAKTDVLAAVHGAGNIHVLFLPDHAKFVEFFPPGFHGRVRFEFISKCLGIPHLKRNCSIVEKLKGGKITVSIEPKH